MCYMQKICKISGMMCNKLHYGNRFTYEIKFIMNRKALSSQFLNYI